MYHIFFSNKRVPNLSRKTCQRRHPEITAWKLPRTNFLSHVEIKFCSDRALLSEIISRQTWTPLYIALRRSGAELPYTVERPRTVSQRTIAQDANDIARYVGISFAVETHRTLIDLLLAARGAKRDHESETTRSRSSWILDTMVTPAKVSVRRPRHSKLCRGHEEEAGRLIVAPLAQVLWCDSKSNAL